MDSNAKNNNLINDNSGSTLLTVLVAIGLITVLASIILSSTLMDARMKSMDRKSKNEFYYAEKGLNDIYTEIGEEVTKIAANAYEDALLIVGDSSSAEVNTRYRKKCANDIFDYLKKVDHSLNDSGATPLVKCVTSKTVVSWAGTIQEGKTDGTGYVDLSTPANPKELADITRTIEKTRTIMKDVVITSTDTKGFQSVVTADIIIDVPNLNFFGDNEDVGNYGIIASEGLVMEGGTQSNPNVILGNVYAGVGKNSENKYVGGINLTSGSYSTFAGDYIVAHGNIELDNGANLTINSKYNPVAQSNVWCESIIVGKKDIANETKNASGEYNSAVLQTYLNGSKRTSANFYALNDLNIEGNGGIVRIAGNYYGYNPNIEETVENINKRADSSETIASATNSSIIVNGYSATLDMEGIKNLIVNGKAYVQLGEKNEVATAESVALKTNQQLYLIPTAFLSCANPAIIELTATENTPEKIRDYATKYFREQYIRDNTINWWADNLIQDIKSESTPLDVRISKSYDENGKTYVVAYAYLPFLVEESGAKIAYKWNAATKKYDKQSGTTPGTDGTVTAETAFFNTVLGCTSETDNPSGFTQAPTPYTLHEQVFGSIKNENFFDLQECILGDNDAHENSQIFANAALVEYTSISGKEAKKIDNTIGSLTAQGYKDNLYHRYRNLCYALNSVSNVPLNDDTNSVKDISDLTVYPSYTAADWWNSAFPIANILINLPSGNVTGPEYSDAGTIEFCDSKTITGDFQGIVIANNITVNSANVRGLLIAKKKITVKNSKIMSDQGLVERRISNEINAIKNGDASLSDSSSDGYLIKYLKDADASDAKYTDSVVNEEKQVEFNYNNFMHYENWQKGQR